MRRPSRSGDRMPRPAASVDDPERGSAALEFILAGVVLLVPLVYLIVALGMIQQQALGVEAGSRHIARAISTAQDPDEARERVELVADAVAVEYGMDADALGISIDCVPGGASCPAAGATLVVTLRTTVALPLVPALLGLDRLAAVPVEARAVQRMSRLWGTG